MALPSAFVDAKGDYVVRMGDGTEVERVSAAGDTSPWTRAGLRRIVGDCPRAMAGGPDCRVVLVHTNARGLNLGFLGAALSLKDGPGQGALVTWEKERQPRTQTQTQTQTGPRRRLDLAYELRPDGSREYFWRPTSSRPMEIETADNTTIVSPFICILENPRDRMRDELRDKNKKQQNKKHTQQTQQENKREN